ncbi:PROX1 protein, partial [Polypterus senegalus]
MQKVTSEPTEPKAAAYADIAEVISGVKEQDAALLRKPPEESRKETQKNEKVWGSKINLRFSLSARTFHSLPGPRVTLFLSRRTFNRCITSQLIKWFSNFREFYYIQMEKFARQAINDGITGTDELNVTRDCELYRALNMHYNKANDFEVPERFLEVAQITLREFFNAIVAGKDVDPSWKKAIYKVICKLDSEVPEIFKSPNCLQELLHE